MIDEWYVGEKDIPTGWCNVCGKYSGHAAWCIIVNSCVQYAVTIVTKANQFMSEADHLRLRTMGVKWVDEP